MTVCEHPNYLLIINTRNGTKSPAFYCIHKVQLWLPHSNQLKSCSSFYLQSLLSEKETHQPSWTKPGSTVCSSKPVCLLCNRLIFFIHLKRLDFFLVNITEIKTSCWVSPNCQITFSSGDLKEQSLPWDSGWSWSPFQEKVVPSIALRGEAPERGPFKAKMVFQIPELFSSVGSLSSSPSTLPLGSLVQASRPSPPPLTHTHSRLFLLWLDSTSVYLNHILYSLISLPSSSFLFPTVIYKCSTLVYREKKCRCNCQLNFPGPFK